MTGKRSNFIIQQSSYRKKEERKKEEKDQKMTGKRNNIIQQSFNRKERKKERKNLCHGIMLFRLTEQMKKTLSDSGKSTPKRVLS